MPTTPNLSNIQKRFVPIMWVVGPILIVAVIALWLVTTAQRSAPRVTRSAESEIAPGDSLRLGVSGTGIEQCDIRVDGIPQTGAVLDVASKALVIEPESVWPVGSTMELTISCDTRQIHSQSISVKSATELTIEEQGAAQSRLDGENARQNQEFFENNPFVDSYPIRTDAFVARYLSAEKIIYVLPLQPIDNRDQFKETVRQAANAVGTPAEIPIVLSDEYDAYNGDSTQ